MPKSVSPPSPESDVDPRRRILQTAREHLFTAGYASLTMDLLAHELGMSKKTLYVHFEGKEALLLALFDDIGRRLRREMDAVLNDPAATFTQKLSRVVAVAASYVGRANPVLLRELERYAPAVYARIDELRQRTIPYVFSRLIRSGVEEGRVRPGIDPDFAAEFWLQAVRGLIQPGVLERHHVSAGQMLARAVDLYFGGLLTPAGRKDYAKHAHLPPVA